MRSSTPYIQYQRTRRNTSLGNVLGTLKDELKGIQDEIEKKQTIVEQYRRNNPLVTFQGDGSATSPTMIRLNITSQHYAELRSRRIDMQAVYPPGYSQLQILQRQEADAYKEFLDAQDQCDAGERRRCRLRQGKQRPDPCSRKTSSRCRTASRGSKSKATSSSTSQTSPSPNPPSRPVGRASRPKARPSAWRRQSV